MCIRDSSEVGDSAGGDTNQANAAEQDANNVNEGQELILGDQSQTNDLENENNQAIINDQDAEGGDADNEGDIELTNELVTVLVSILNSILGSGDGNVIIDTGTDVTTDTD